MNDTSCIWCLRPTKGEHVEHIIPEALGCPEGFVLPSSVVCKKCNNGLAHLDQAVADEFDLLAFRAGVPRKHGKSPAVKSRGNFTATIEPSGPTYSINMESHSVKAHDGSNLGPFRGKKRNIRANFSRERPLASVSYDVPFGDNPKFVRGLTKIALSSLAYFLGPDEARSSRFNSVRSFVVSGKGNRHVMVKPSNDKKYLNQAWAPYVNEDGHFVCTFRIAVCDFLIDLSENEDVLTEIEASMFEQYGEGGWAILPI